MNVHVTINTLNDEWDKEFKSVESFDKLLEDIQYYYGDNKENPVTSVVLTVVL